MVLHRKSQPCRFCWARCYCTCQFVAPILHHHCFSFQRGTCRARNSARLRCRTSGRSKWELEGDLKSGIWHCPRSKLYQLAQERPVCRGRSDTDCNSSCCRFGTELFVMLDCCLPIWRRRCILDVWILLKDQSKDAKLFDSNLKAELSDWVGFLAKRFPELSMVTSKPFFRLCVLTFWRQKSFPFGFLLVLYFLGKSGVESYPWLSCTLRNC